MTWQPFTELQNSGARSLKFALEVGNLKVGAVKRTLHLLAFQAGADLHIGEHKGFLTTLLTVRLGGDTGALAVCSTAAYILFGVKLVRR